MDQQYETGWSTFEISNTTKPYHVLLVHRVAKAWLQVSGFYMAMAFVYHGSEFCLHWWQGREGFLLVFSWASNSFGLL